jgi:hypothetical protein
MELLGMTSDKLLIDKNAACNLDALCSLLEDKLAYDSEERDMVVMHHEFKIKWDVNKEVMDKSC